MTSKCLRCEKPFSPRVAGKKQKFCSLACKKGYEKHLRQWSLDQAVKGRVNLNASVKQKDRDDG